MTTAPGPARSRLLTSDARRQPLAPLELDLGTIVHGTPSAGWAVLGQYGAAEVGVWELTVGTVTDVEVDEVFVVVSGAGTIAFADGTKVELVPGAVVRLFTGDRTTWTITSTLRKVVLI